MDIRRISIGFVALLFGSGSAMAQKKVKARADKSAGQKSRLSPQKDMDTEREKKIRATMKNGEAKANQCIESYLKVNADQRGFIPVSFVASQKGKSAQEKLTSKLRRYHYSHQCTKTTISARKVLEHNAPEMNIRVSNTVAKGKPVRIRSLVSPEKINSMTMKRKESMWTM